MPYTIEKVEWEHAGTYRCTAENRLGRHSVLANLTVVGKIEISLSFVCSFYTKGISFQFIEFCVHLNWDSFRRPYSKLRS